MKNHENNLRIAHVCLGRPGLGSANGVEKTVFLLSTAQATLGNEVSVFSVSDEPPPPIPGVEVASVRQGIVPFSLPRELKDYLSQWHPHVVHLHSVYTPLNAGLSRWLLTQQVPYVTRPAGGLSPLVLKKRRHIKYPYKWLFELPMHNNALFVHAWGDSTDIRNYGVTSPVINTSKGVEGTIVPYTSGAWLDKNVGVDAATIRLVFLGRLHIFHKGLDALIRAVAELRDTRVKLILIGPNVEGSIQRLEELAASLGIGGQIRFHEPIFNEDKYAALAGADLFVHPSRTEGGIPYSVLEAAAMAKPILTTDGADKEGILDRYSGCIKVAPEERSIADGIRRFLNMTLEQREKLGKNARLMIEREFRMEAVAEQLNNAYQSLLGARIPNAAKQIV